MIWWSWVRYYATRAMTAFRRIVARVLVCPTRGHRFKFAPRCCIRCGKPLT